MLATQNGPLTKCWESIEAHLWNQTQVMRHRMQSSIPELMNTLSKMSKRSQTTKALENEHAQEDYFALCVSSAEMTIHLMFAAGRPNYSRYGTLHEESTFCLTISTKHLWKSNSLFALCLGFSTIYDGQTSSSNASECHMVMDHLESSTTDENHMKIWSVSMGSCNEHVGQLRMMDGLDTKFVMLSRLLTVMAILVIGQQSWRPSWKRHKVGHGAPADY